MQKKFLTTLALAALLLCGFTGQALAKEGKEEKGEKAAKITLRGTVEKVDVEGSTVTIVDKQGAKHELRVSKRSEIEIDRGENQDDVDATLADVKQGDKVKVKALQGKKKLRLKEMDIYR